MANKNQFRVWDKNEIMTPKERKLPLTLYKILQKEKSKGQGKIQVYISEPDTLPDSKEWKHIGNI